MVFTRVGSEMLNRIRNRNNGIGAGYLLAQGMIICLLLIANGALVRSLINVDWGEEVRISQSIQLVLPVTMIFAELWLFDLFFASRTRHPT